jgi:hypothetical protein
MAVMAARYAVPTPLRVAAAVHCWHGRVFRLPLTGLSAAQAVVLACFVAFAAAQVGAAYSDWPMRACAQARPLACRSCTTTLLW